MALLLWLILNSICVTNILTAELAKEATNKGKKIYKVYLFVLKLKIGFLRTLDFQILNLSIIKKIFEFKVKLKMSR